MSDITKHTLWLREGDFDYLKEYFPKKGASYVVRQLTANFVDSLRANTAIDPELESSIND